MLEGHCGQRVFSLLLSLFNCEQFHCLRTYRIGELEQELIIWIFKGYWMLDKSKSSVQDTKSTRNRTSVLVLTTRANWRFSRNISEQNWMNVYQSNHWSKSSCVQIKTQIEPLCRRIKRVCSSICGVFTFTLTLLIILNWKFDRAAIHYKTLGLQQLFRELTENVICDNRYWHILLFCRHGRENSVRAQHAKTHG